MTVFRKRMTRIRRVVERFPADGDIYGFPGVTKAMLLEAIDGAYNLSQNITEQGSGSFVFEVISLKRASGEIYQRHKDILDSDDRTPSKEQFDEFLDDLSWLVEKVQVVYSLQTKGGLRSAEELGAASRQAAQFKELHDQYAVELGEADMTFGCHCRTFSKTGTRGGWRMLGAKRLDPQSRENRPRLHPHPLPSLRRRVRGRVVMPISALLQDS